MKLIQISDFKLGRCIQGFYLCNEKHIRNTKSGDLFLDMIFSDSSGTIPGKLWDLVDQFQDRFEIGDPVAVKGKVTRFNDHLQLSVTHINQATNIQYRKYGYSPDLLIKSVDEPVKELWKRLIQLINTLPNPYRKLTMGIFQSHEEKIKVLPESVNHHQLIRGGYLKYLITKGEIVVDILPYYPNLNKELALCGMLLYDIGKVKAYNDNIQVSYTDIGKLIGYPVLGRDIVKAGAMSIKNFPEDILLNLEHIILSQQSSVEQGFIENPRLYEALFIHQIASLDKQMNNIQDAQTNSPNVENRGSYNHLNTIQHK